MAAPDGGADQEELRAAMAKLNEMGFTNVSDVVALKKVADDTLAGGDAQALLVKLLSNTSRLQQMAGDPSPPPAANGAASDVNMDVLLKQLQANTDALAALATAAEKA
eukprot:TRINITY_DN3007_c0_g1_i11.p2 TRINITY_DN3007_c0_g1~~TRINITY_DN3007_c0_g1_i11.p2  ORF type:complete len:108 (+),score=40.77 TRINITY_DN3007_c0_g1_i11:87-410(+)